jgi:hypothetical protein
MESVNDLLKLFMRQAELERAAKQPGEARDTVKQSPGAGTRRITCTNAASRPRPDEATAA